MKKTGFFCCDQMNSYEYTRNGVEMTRMRNNILSVDIELSWYRISILLPLRDLSFQEHDSIVKIGKNSFSSFAEDANKLPARKVVCTVACHFGWAEVNLLNDCLVLLGGSKSNKSPDFHTEMNWNVFSIWRESRMLPKFSWKIKDEPTFLIVTCTIAILAKMIKDQQHYPVTNQNL